MGEAAGKRDQTFLGFDFGFRRIGVAVGESLTGAARPLATVQCREGRPDWPTIETLIQQWQPDGLIVGLPHPQEDRPHRIRAAAERFGRQLTGRFSLPVHWVDESLSSVEAEQRLNERGITGNRLRRDKGTVDRVAATVILETWLAGHTDDHAS